MSQLQSVAINTLRAPLCALMWVRLGPEQYTFLTALVRAVRLYYVAFLTTVLANAYVRHSFLRSRLSAPAADKAKTD
jgi:hypothetical protein